MDIVTLGAALNGSKKYTDQVTQSLAGSDIGLAGYTKGTVAKQDVSPTDNVNQGLGKIEKRVSDNENNISLKANTSDVNTATTNLQTQIDQIAQAAGTGSADTEVAQARVGADGTSYQTLKARLDGENSDVREEIKSEVENIRSDIGGSEIIFARSESDKLNGDYQPNAKNILVFVEGVDYLSATLLDISEVGSGGRLKVNTSLYSKHGAYIVNENNEVLDYINGENAVERGYSVGTAITEVEMIIPNGAKYVTSDIRSTLFTGIDNFTVKAVTTLVTDGLNEELEELREEISNVGNYIFNPDVTINDGSFISTNNTISTDTRYSYTDYIDIAPYTKIEFPMYFSGSGACAVFVDENKNIVSVVTSPAQGTIFSDVVPVSAKWIRMSIYTSQKSKFYFKATQDVSKKLFEITSTKTNDSPLSNIIQDGGFVKIFQKIGVIGDSLSSGAMSPPSDVVLPEDEEDTTDYLWYSWIQYMARYTGLTAYNFSMGGLSAHGLRYGQSNPNIQTIINNLMSDEQKCKAYYVALGHNDRNYLDKNPSLYSIGTIADCHLDNPESNPDTFYGNYAWVINKIKETQPRAKIFLITMKIADVFADYNTVIRDMVNLFNTHYGNTDVYLIDMEGTALVPSWEYTNGHGNTMGYLNYSYQIATYTDWLIRNNKDDFKLVQFIGTPYLN